MHYSQQGLFAMLDDGEWAALSAVPETTIRGDVTKMTEETWRLLRAQRDSQSLSLEQLFIRSEIVPDASIAPALVLADWIRPS